MNSEYSQCNSCLYHTFHYRYIAFHFYANSEVLQYRLGVAHRISYNPMNAIHHILFNKIDYFIILKQIHKPNSN